jgi:hypothetical protein
VAWNGRMNQRQPRWESKKLRDSARGRDCTMRSPWCNGNPETTVWCHSNHSEHGKANGTKAHDIFGFYGCSDCHNYYDLASRQQGISNTDRRELFRKAHEKSLLIVVTEGILK